MNPLLPIIDLVIMGNNGSIITVIIGIINCIITDVIIRNNEAIITVIIFINR